MMVKTVVEKGDKGTVRFYHTDCPSASDDCGGVIKRESGICEDCGQEIPKNLMSSVAMKTLREQLTERFRPNEDPEDTMSVTKRTTGPRVGILEGRPGGSPNSEPY